MPPLTGVGERCAPRATWSCIDERNRSPVALALRVYPPLSRVDSLGIACSAPWHELAFQHPDRTSSSQGCLMSLRLSCVDQAKLCVARHAHAG